MQPQVWNRILFTLIESFVFVWDIKVHATQVLACYGSQNACGFFNMTCLNDQIIQVGRLQYGLKDHPGESCQNDVRLKCTFGSYTCCALHSDKCIVDFPTNRSEWVRNNCMNKPLCGPFPADQMQFSTLDTCNGKTSNYIILEYTCVSGTDTTMKLTSATNVPSSSGNKSSSSGKSEDGISSPAIIGVVIAAMIVIVVVPVAVIIFKRRQKKSTKDDTHIYDLPKRLTNHMYEGTVEADKSSEVVETSSYDIISDESVLNYSLPGKNKKDATNIPVTVDKYDNISADEYDKIEFELKGATKASNYDRLAVLKGTIGDDPYSHVPNRSTTATATVNDYSPCKPISKDTLRNGDDYSHADLERDCTINPESEIIEEDSYNHIDFDDTKHPMRNENAANGETKSKSETNSPTCTVVKPRDMVNENHHFK